MSVYVRTNFKYNGDKIIAEMERNEQALIAVGIQIEEAARAESPIKTGNLRGSITWAIHNEASSPWAQSKGLGLKKHGVKNTVWIGTNVHYAPHLEYGTKNMAARPFLLPAIWYSRDRIIRTLRSILGAKFKGFKT